MTKLHLTNKHNKLYQDILVELKVFMYDLGIWSMKLPCPTIGIQVKSQKLKAISDGMENEVKGEKSKVKGEKS